MSRVEIITFGCRLNAYESEVIRRAAQGLDDAVVVNTCAVTAEAERQARQAIRRVRRERPTARIIVTGCAATLAPERYAALAGVDAVLDNAQKLKPESYTARSPTSPQPSPPPRAEREAVPPQDFPSPPFGGEREGPAAQAREGEVGRDALRRIRAYLQVQQGCDHRCTFCIIPYARGASRSLPITSIIAEARELVADGAREIVLTGVDLTAYGLDLPGHPTLGMMCRALLAALPELQRLRLSSLDPSEIDDDLWSLLADEPRLMPHLHLSLQAGDDLILKRMRRRHSRAEAIATTRRARALRPEVAIGADLIAGFPTESDDMFRRSLDLVAECGIAFLHAFPYSARPGTPAARMPPVDPALVRERAARLRAAGAASLDRELSARIGSNTAVLVERPGLGRAEFYAPVACDPAIPVGAVVAMRIVAAARGRLVGEAVA